METQFLVPTETYAEKVRQVLARAGIGFSLRRVTGKDGCSFSFRSAAPPAQVEQLLSRAHIPYRTG
jgi:hypothetical protein